MQKQQPIVPDFKLERAFLLAHNKRVLDLRDEEAACWRDHATDIWYTGREYFRAWDITDCAIMMAKFRCNRV